MRNKMKLMAGVLSVTLAGGPLLPPAALTALAADTDMAGYHDYVTTEDEAIDHWYGVARGTYLKEGICGIKRAGTAKVSVSGTTTAHRVCDSVKVAVYLDESSDGGSHFGSIGSYYFAEEDASSCYGSKSNISVTSGYYYRARGTHSVKKGSTQETTSTCSSSLKAS